MKNSRSINGHISHSLNHLNESLEYAQNNKDALGATIESGLLELLTEEAEKCDSNVEVAITKAETKQLIDFIAESMKNHLHKLNGNTNRYRYSRISWACQ